MALSLFFSAFAMAALRRGHGVLFCAAFWVTPIAAETAYLGAPADLLDAADRSGIPLASLSVAAKLDVLANSAQSRQVAVRGWIRPGAERVLLAYPGKQIVVARLEPAAIQQLRRLESVADPETGTGWDQVEIEGWIEATYLRPILEPIWASAWELFAERCTACHERRVPSDYTANQWRSHLRVMGPRTGLPDTQQELILTFLQHHARDTIGLSAGE